MNEITWLSHAWYGPPKGTHGPGSQGGKLYTFLSKRLGRKKIKDYINSPEFIRGDYSGYVGKNVTTLMKAESRTMDNYSGPNWTYGRGNQEVTFKKPKPRLTAGSSNKKKYISPELNKTTAEQKSSNKKKYDSPELNITTAEQKSSNKKKYDSPELNITTAEQKSSNKKKYSSPSFAKSMNQKIATEALKADTAYRKALAENEALRHPKISYTGLTKAVDQFKGAATSLETVSKGVSNAWEALHNAKYRNEDRSKNVRELSNAELRNAIERIKLDQEYNSLTMPQKSKGYDRTMAALSLIGTAATVTATGLSIAAGVKAIGTRTWEEKKK